MSHHQHNREAARSSNQDCRLPSESERKLAEIETRRLAKSHYENFLVATVLVPRRLRQHFYNVYAFCRTADDLADESPSPEAALGKLADFQEQLDHAFKGRSKENLFVALAGTIEQCHLPQRPFNELLDAFRQDQRKTRYADFDELLDYCRRSANPVGHIVLRLGDCFDEENAALADKICTGLQLANFWQDVARDHTIGRIYMPADQMNRFGVREEMLAASATPMELRHALAVECDRAEGFIRQGLPLAGRVPRWLSGDVKLFAHGGLATLDAIRRIEFDVLRSRPTVSKWRQSKLLIQAMLRLL